MSRDAEDTESVIAGTAQVEPPRGGKPQPFSNPLPGGSDSKQQSGLPGSTVENIRQEYLDEIAKLQTQMEQMQNAHAREKATLQNDAQAEVARKLSVMREELGNQKQLLREAAEEVQQIEEEMKRKELEHLQREEQWEAKLAEAKAQEDALAAAGQGQGSDGETDDAPSARRISTTEGPKQMVLEGTLLKYGAQGKRKPKQKHVWFVHANGLSVLEWADSAESQQTNRVRVKGVSRDPGFVSRKLTDEQNLTFFVVIASPNKAIVFQAADAEERDYWVGGMKKVVKLVTVDTL